MGQRQVLTDDQQKLLKINRQAEGADFFIYGNVHSKSGVLRETGRLIGLNLKASINFNIGLVKKFEFLREGNL